MNLPNRISTSGINHYFWKKQLELMHFKHPEILYFLFLLIIPVLIHLFRLQRFKRIAFSNVKFLQEIELESRKSSVLRKRLILLCRLLALACLILAFSKPYLKKYDETRTWQNIIYLDNSLSMQAEGNQGNDLLNEHKNWLLENLDNDQGSYSLVSNDQFINDLDLDQFKKSLLGIDFHPIRKTPTQIDRLIQDQNFKENTSLNIVYISDFKDEVIEFPSDSLSNQVEYHFVQASNREIENISLDSLWIDKNETDAYSIFTSISSQNMTVEDYGVSIYLDEEPYGKSSVSLQPGEEKTVEFKIPYLENGVGKISTNDHKIQFDNELYFSLPKEQKLRILAIGKTSEYLERIYLPDEFVFTTSRPEQLDPVLISKQDLIVLNELENISKPLQLVLTNFVKNRGNLVIIPALNSDFHSYNSLLSDFELGSIAQLSKREKKVTKINYDHPFFKEVFKEKKTNFLYPTVRHSYEGDLSRSSNLLSFDDNNPFVCQKRYYDNYVYWISAPLSNNNSNFVNSPLIVPLLYNFSNHQMTIDQPYYLIGHENEISILSDTLGKSAVELVNENRAFIPFQKRKSDRIIITTLEEPLQAGIYGVSDRIHHYVNLAYNFDRQESLESNSPSIIAEDLPPNSFFYASLDAAAEVLNRTHENQSLWQLFTIFVLVFLSLETGLQKFLKN